MSKIPGFLASPAGEAPDAKLRRMDSPRPLRVTLTGDVSGAYVVVEQRPDGSLVVAPDSSEPPGAASRTPASPVMSLFSGLFTPARKSMSGVEVLEGWGVELDEEERVEEFFVADVNGEAGFLAITSERFIFVASRGQGSTVVHDHLLSAARDVEVVRRGLGRKLRVSWHGAETLVGGLDRKAVMRLRHLLERQGLT
jgi:hypothetical protein